MAGENLSKTSSSSGDQSPMAGEGEKLSETPSSSDDQSPTAGEGENRSETPSSSGDQSPTAGEGENLSETPSSSGDQSPMVVERQNLSKTLPPSDQHQEMMPTAWEHLLTASAIASATATATATATASSSGDQVPCNQSRDYDFHHQCKVKPTKLSASHECLEELFRDFRARRTGILKALTTEAERFYSLCDPDETWAVNLPAEEVPPEIPEPVLGINYARDGTDKRDWLALVAVHSDSWLLAVAFYLGANFGFDKESRRELFTMINDLPTIYEVVKGAAQEPTNERTPKNSSEINKSPSQPPSPNGDPPACSSKRACEE